MKIIIKNENILLKNNFLFIKNIYYCKTKIPYDLNLFFYNNCLNIYSYNYNKKNIVSFYKLVKNLIIGVQKLWEKEVYISGIGYKIFVKEKKIYFNLGFSNDKILIIPDYIKIILKKDKIILSSVYKDKIGVYVNQILKLKKYDPYKKKGLYLENPRIKKSSKKKQ